MINLNVCGASGCLFAMFMLEVFKGILLLAITIILCSRFQYCFYNASITSRVNKVPSLGKITQRLAFCWLQWWEPDTSPIHKIFTLLESDIWNPRCCHSVTLHNHGFTPMLLRHSIPAPLYQNGLKLNTLRHCSTALTSRPPFLPFIWLGDTQNLEAQVLVISHKTTIPALISLASYLQLKAQPLPLDHHPASDSSLDLTQRP